MFGNPMVEEQKYPLKKLGDCCVINPKRSKIALSDTDTVSFVPMPSVSEEGYLQDVSDAEYGSVKNGFTYFENGDVLFAKITPCMENGKGAIAHDLRNGIGMGSTEFHVLRPLKGRSNSYWLLTLTRLPEFRDRAAHNMSGTGGQQRVRADFLENFMIGLPPIEKQIELETICRVADKSKFSCLKSQFIEMFGDPVTNSKGWPTKPLSEVAPESPSRHQIEGIVWNLNLDMIESNSGKVISKIYEEVNRLLSVSQFDQGNVLFSKLRPYLNKVVVPDEIGYATTELVPLRPDQELLNKYFLAHLLRGHHFVSYANAIATGTKMPRMPMNSLRSFKCILPPMELQQQFVDIAEQADKSKQIAFSRAS